MGIVNSKDRNQLVDHGSLVSQNALGDTWDYKSVKKLILHGRLAPFYKGVGELSSLPSCSSALARRMYQDNIECPICLLVMPQLIAKQDIYWIVVLSN
ncbi:hypothetical protein CLU79DRAFT_732997, partial [Phycomyces nitens]